MTAVAAPPVAPDAELRRPAGSLPAVWFVLLYLALLLLIPSELVVPQIGAAGTPANLLGLGMLLWWTCAKVGGQIATPANPMHVVLWILLACVLLSVANGLANGWTRPMDVRQHTPDVPWDMLVVPAETLFDKSVLGASRGLIAIAGWLGASLVLIDGTRSWRDLDLVVDGLVLLTATMALIGIHQFFTGDNLARFIQVPGLAPVQEFGASISRADFNRVSATATHPIEFCVVLTAVLPIALHRAIHPRAISLAGRLGAAWLPAAAIVLAIPMALSRSGVLVVAVSTVVLFLGWSWSRRWWALLLVPAALMGMRAALPGLLDTVADLFIGLFTDPSVTGRTDDYAVVLGIYADHPLLGRGMGTFIPSYYRILDNQLLLTLVELGAVGLTALLLVFTTAFYLSRHCKRHALTAERRHLGLVVSAAVLGILAAYPTFDVWSFAKAGAITFVLFSLAGALRHLCRTPEESGRGHDQGRRHDTAP